MLLHFLSAVQLIERFFTSHGLRIQHLLLLQSNPDSPESPWRALCLGESDKLTAIVL